tara:strand:- start:47 stop:208 length:162 start_codon:yes stop_codon:yes gene_type:complete
MSIEIPVIPFDEQNTEDAAGKKPKSTKPSYNLDGSKRDPKNPKSYPSGLGTGY